MREMPFGYDAEEVVDLSRAISAAEPEPVRLVVVPKVLPGSGATTTARALHAALIAAGTAASFWDDPSAGPPARLLRGRVVVHDDGDPRRADRLVVPIRADLDGAAAAARLLGSVDGELARHALVVLIRSGRPSPLLERRIRKSFPQRQFVVPHDRELAGRTVAVPRCARSTAAWRSVAAEVLRLPAPPRRPPAPLLHSSTR